MIIHLGPLLPVGSSDATRRLDAGRVVLRCRKKPSYSVLLQLGFTKPRSHPRAGELLPHRFTVSGPRSHVRLNRTSKRGQVVFFSVALSADLPAPSLTANLPCEVPTFLSGFTPSDHALNSSLLEKLLCRKPEHTTAARTFYHISARNQHSHLRA